MTFVRNSKSFHCIHFYTIAPSVKYSDKVQRLIVWSQICDLHREQKKAQDKTKKETNFMFFLTKFERVFLICDCIVIHRPLLLDVLVFLFLRSRSNFNHHFDLFHFFKFFAKLVDDILFYTHALADDITMSKTF